MKRTNGGASVGLSEEDRLVQALYLAELGRAGSAAELSSWLPTLRGPNGQATVALSIENSPEGRTNLVRGWYRTYLGRPATGGEEAGRVVALLAGTSEEAVLGGILGSDEFLAHAQTLAIQGTPQERFVRLAAPAADRPHAGRLGGRGPGRGAGRRPDPGPVGDGASAVAGVPLRPGDGVLRCSAAPRRWHGGCQRVEQFGPQRERDPSGVRSHARVFRQGAEPVSRAR